MKNITLALLVLVTIRCGQPTIDKRAEGDKVMQLSKEWATVASSGNVDKTVSYWADDAYLVSAGQPPLKGKQAIRQMVIDSYKIPGFRISWEPQSVEVSDNGDMAYVIENSHVSFSDSAGKPVTQHSKAVSIWKKQRNGTWKNVVDISTPDATQNQ
jgi:uncharacterized protein (TIGR02246 family)